MKIEGWLFGMGFVFFVPISVVYWFLSGDPVGTTALALSGALAFLIAFYVLYTAKRVYPRPEDRLDANVDAASGNRGTPFELIMSVPDALIASKGDHHKPRQRQQRERAAETDRPHRHE